MVDNVRNGPGGIPSRRILFESAKNDQILPECLQLLEIKDFTFEEMLIAAVLIYQRHYQELKAQLTPIEAAALIERQRILALLDKELAYLEDGDYWKEDEFLRISAKALRQFRGQITGEGQE